MKGPHLVVGEERDRDNAPDRGQIQKSQQYYDDDDGGVWEEEEKRGGGERRNDRWE